MTIRRSYTVAQKLIVIGIAESIGITAAARKCRVCHSMVSRWKKCKETLLAAKKPSRKLGCGRTPVFPEGERVVAAEVKALRQEGMLVNIQHLQRQILQLRDAELSQGRWHLQHFKASYTWVSGFMKRFNLSLRSITTTTARPNCRKPRTAAATMSVEEKISKFRDHVEHLIEENQYDSDCIVNFDETPVWFDTMPTTTIDYRGIKDVVAAKKNNDRHRVTAALAVTKSGKFLPPGIITKSLSKAAREHPETTHREIGAAHVWQQVCNTMTSAIMVDYIKRVLVPFCASMAIRRNCLSWILAQHISLRK